jgi:general secretion pathway protein G
MIRRRGFTLIEVLVVVAIIGMLAMIVIANVGTSRKKGNDGRRISDISQLKLALELYYDANGMYPATLDPLSTSNYIATIPKDPIGNTAYSYALYALPSSPAICVGYHLGASLEDANNQTLTGDVDATAPPSGMVMCTGSTDFSGVDSGKCKAGDTGVACYDVRS